MPNSYTKMLIFMFISNMKCMYDVELDKEMSRHSPGVTMP